MCGDDNTQAVTLEAFGNGSFVRNQAIRGANDNEWLLPVYFARDGIGAANKQRNSQYSALARRYDDSMHWELFNMSSPGQALVQPTVVCMWPHRARTTLPPAILSPDPTLILIRQVRLLDGTLKAWFRDRDAGFIFTSESNDDGHAWTRPTRTVLPNNNKAIQVSRLPVLRGVDRLSWHPEMYDDDAEFAVRDGVGETEEARRKASRGNRYLRFGRDPCQRIFFLRQNGGTGRRWSPHPRSRHL